MSKENYNEDDINLVGEPKWKSQYGAILHNGRRYPPAEFFIKNGFKYSYKIFDLFADITYDEMQKSPNSKRLLSFDNKRDNKLLVRELLIEEIGKRMSKDKSKNFSIINLTKYNFEKEIQLFNPGSNIGLKDFDIYLNLLRERLKHKQKLTSGKANSKKYTQIPPEHIDTIKKWAIRASIVLALGMSCIFVKDNNTTTFEEYVDSFGENDTTYKNLVNKLPKHNDVLNNSLVRYFPTENNEEMNQTNEYVKELYNQEGAKGLLSEYYSLLFASKNRTLTDDEIKSFTAISYALIDAVPKALAYEALYNYCKENSKADFDISEVEYISFQNKQFDDDSYDAFIVSIKDNSDDLIIYAPDFSIDSANKAREKITDLYNGEKDNPSLVEKINKTMSDTLNSTLMDYSITNPPNIRDYDARLDGNGVSLKENHRRDPENKDPGAR